MQRFQITLIVFLKQGWKYDDGSISEFTSPKHDRTEVASIGIGATRPIGEESSLLLNVHTTSNQYQEADDISKLWFYDWFRYHFR